MNKERIAVPCTIMRGGTSKAIFMRMADVPSEPAARERFLLALFGSPDKRQIDGLGGADPLTSKFAMIGPATRPDADIDYTFAQIGIEDAYVSYEIVCGNISSATGVYAIEEGLVPAVEPVTTVRVHNTNTNSILIIKVPVRDGEVLIEGDFAIDGVPGTGAEVALDYSDTSGGATGRLLPTGNVRDSVQVPSLRRTLDVSIVDIGTICVYFRAEDLGMNGSELPGELPAEAYRAAEEIRLAAAALCGLPQSGRGDITPFQIMIAPPQGYAALTGEAVKADDIDFAARQINVDGWMHKAFSGGASTCTAVAAQIEGTIPHESSSVRTTPRGVRIGHPSGALPIFAQVERDPRGAWVVREVHFSRTVRRLMDGTAYLLRSILQD
ncbi:PrpF domain-containing protein [Sphingorhabdus sp.]|jgi:2-methylaconitate cis-trans-isomerase PrpF